MIRADVDTKVELRKCCHIDQVYHLGNGIQNCVNSSQSSWMSSFDHNSNSMVTIGLPGNCSGSDLMLLKPNEMAADRHFLLSSGQLILPHRFWILSPDEYCMDDFIFKNSSTLVSNSFHLLASRSNKTDSPTDRFHLKSNENLPVLICCTILSILFPSNLRIVWI